jgi:hypothetical protein
MTDARSLIESRWRQGRLFVLALLLALVSALVPALCASGPPASRATGSAFDPTTSAVALRSRAQSLVRVEQPGESAPHMPALRQVAPLFTITAAPAIALPTILLLYPLVWPARRTAPSPGLRHITRARPRAPPHRVN